MQFSHSHLTKSVPVFRFAGFGSSAQTAPDGCVLLYCSLRLSTTNPRLLSSGAMVQFEKGSSMQIIIAVVIIIIHLTLLVNFKPYNRSKHTVMALFVYLAMCFVFLGGLLLSIMEAVGGYNIKHVFLRGLSTEVIAVMMITSLLSVMIVAAVILADEVRAAATSIVLQYEHTRQTVTFPPRPAMQFHLFLSHVW
jgi:hypothetical protein